jgi:PAS domain S-box-containing protein
VIRQKILEIIIENLPHGLLLVDGNGMITEFNRAAEDISGYSRRDVIGRRHAELFGCGLDKDACLITRAAFRGSGDIESMELPLGKKNGETITVAATLFPLFDSDGDFMGGVELFMDISARKKKERERKNMLSMFAHDMKNPIVVAKGFLSRLMCGKAGDLTPEQREYCMMIETEMNRVHELIMDFLQFSRFEAREYVPEYSTFCLKTELARLLESERVLAEKRAVTISGDTPEGSALEITADLSMVKRVMSNLLDNAIRHSFPGGLVTVTVNETDEFLVISVRDHGVGIAEDHMPFIFDAFYRAGKDSKGTGLGLFISRTIVEAHGGRIWAESAPGKGSCFHFTLPRKPAQTH